MKKRWKWLNRCIVVLLVVMMLLTPAEMLAVTTDDTTSEVVSSEEEPKILAELPENRDAYTKCFKLDNGERMLVQYKDPVHYEDEKGNWVEYDNQMDLTDDVLSMEDESEVIEEASESKLEGITSAISTETSETEENIVEEVAESEISNDKGTLTEEITIPKTEAVTETSTQLSELLQENITDEYKNKKSDIDIRLAKNSRKQNMIKVKMDDYQISWGFENSQKTPVEFINDDVDLEGNDKFIYANNATQKATYKDVFNQVDIEYYLNSAGIKENIILKSKESQKKFEIQYRTKGLTPVQKDEKTIEFKNKKEEVIYTLNAPVMIDDNGEFSDALTLNIKKQKGNKTTIMLSVDENWLNDWSRAYPIIVDPDLEIEASQPAMDSRGITVGGSSRNTTASPEERIGNYNGSQKQFYIKMNQLPELSSGDKITSASLSMGMGNNSTSDIYVYAHDVTSDIPMADITGSNITYDNNVLDYTLAPKQNNSYQSNFDITKSVRGWYEGDDNNGILFESDETTGAYLAVGSVLHYIAAKRPVFKITYKNFKGIEKNGSYHTYAVGTEGEVSLNDFTGDLITQHNVFVGTGSRMPLKIVLTYNSLLYNKIFDNGSPGGYGWQFSFNQYIKLTGSDLERAGYKYIYTDASGTEHYFKQIEDSTTQWEDEDGLGLIIEETNSELILYDSNITKRFSNVNNSGRLLSEEDENGNRIIYTYNSSGNLTQITDGVGRIYQISYDINPQTDVLRISKITDPSNRVVKFEYGTTNNKYDRLVRIRYPDDVTTTFAYYANHRVGTIYSGDGSQTGFTYNSNGKISKISEYGTNGIRGKFLDVSYDENSTLFVDRSGRGETYLFDNTGKLLTVLNGDGIVTNQRSNTSLAVKSGAETYTKNYIKNSNIENNSGFSYGNFGGSSSGTIVYETSQEQVDNEQQQWLGNASFKISNSSAEKSRCFSPSNSLNVTSLRGKSMTASAYIKTQNVNVSENDENAGVAISVIFWDSNGSQISETFSRYLTGSNKWTRLSYTFEVPSNAVTANVYFGLKNAKGTAWYDCVQWEEAPCANDYNILNDSDFSSSTDWTYSSGVVINNGEAIITGKPDEQKKLMQEIIVNQANVALDVSGKVLINSLPIKENRAAAIKVKFIYTNNSLDSDEQFVHFNPNTRISQSNSAVIHPMYEDEKINKIQISFVYDFNLNDMKVYNLNAYPYKTTDNPNVPIDEIDHENEPVETVMERGEIDDYDNYGNLISTQIGKVYLDGDEKILDTNEPYYETINEYDSTGNYKISEQGKGFESAEYEIDPITGLASKITYPDGQIETYTHDDNGLLLTGTAGNITNTYNYDNARNLTSINHNNTNYSYTYDTYGNPSTVSIGNQELYRNIYSLGNLSHTGIEYGNGDKIYYEYDNYDRLIKITNDEETLLEYIYDNKGRVSKEIDFSSNTVTEYQHNQYNSVISKTIWSDTSSFSYLQSQDEEGNKSEITYVNGIARKFSEGFTENVGSYIKNGTLKISENHDNLLRLQSRVTENTGTQTSLRAEYTYVNSDNGNETSSMIESIKYKFGENVITEYSYTYDVNDRITSISENGQIKEQYSYDSIGQLKTVYNRETLKYWNISFDAAGNLHAVNEQALHPTYFHTTGNPYGPIYYYQDSQWKDKLTKYNADVITYDEIGNPLNYRNGLVFEWENGKHLSKVTSSTGDTTYTYNTTGMRTEKTVHINNSTEQYKYYYDDEQLISLILPNNSVIHFYYDQEGRAHSLSYDDNMYYYICNLSGDIKKIVDTNGNVVANYTYNTMGKLIYVKDGTGNIISDSLHIGNVNPLRYRGYLYDTDTGFYYLLSRYYDPETGRFINADTYMDTGTSVVGTNMFAYCDNDFVGGYDPNGKYNRMKVRIYIDRWYNGFNPQYQNLEYRGGDCANYVSQCLEAGGFKQTYSWYHKKTVIRNGAYPVSVYSFSPQWVRVVSHYSYWERQRAVKFERKVTKKTNVKDLIKKSNIQVGDVIYMDDYGNGNVTHAGIISKIGSRKNSLHYSAHSRERYERDIMAYINSKQHYTGKRKLNGTVRILVFS